MKFPNLRLKQRNVPVRRERLNANVAVCARHIERLRSDGTGGTEYGNMSHAVLLSDGQFGCIKTEQRKWQEP